MIQSDRTLSRDAIRTEDEAQSPKTRVLAVDDDELVLVSLRNLFDFETGYELEVETNPSKAVQLLSKERYDVVISDLLMPGMDGIEFLENAARLQPQAARILLTGYGNERRIERAVRELGLHHMDKPWDNAAILRIAGRARLERVRAG